MCGIAGKVDFGGPVDGALIHRMCRSLEHRGPDARGVMLGDGVGLGVQRLAVIDVAGGDQPIYNEDRSVAVVLNGEIYNHAELRAALIERGHRFRTRADTEVLVHLYEEHGERLVEHLRGMFAFAIWDERRRRLLLARDRVGKKPLFWSRAGGRIWFASEISALLQDPEIPRDIDMAAINAYLALQYVPHPLCAFRAIRKLPPATTMSVSADGERCRRYWALDYRDRLDGVSEQELAEMLRERLWEATRVRLVSEVPLGAFLSGGVDSSAVVAAMADQVTEPVKTFSIGFGDAEFDELRYARMVAERFGTDHHEFRVDPRSESIFPRMAVHYGEPFADPSAIPSFHLAELTSRHVTVALNGDGGDESFAGYPKYALNERLERLLGHLPHASRRWSGAVADVIGDGRHRDTLRSRLSRRARTVAMTAAERHAAWSSAFDDGQLSRLLSDELKAMIREPPAAALEAAWTEARADDRVSRMLSVDVETYLPGDLLTKIDIATMAHSVEARSPLLDHELMEFAAAVPVEMKLSGGEKKRLLRLAMRGVLPDEVLDRPKMGFVVPLRRWFREELRSLPEDVLLDRRSVERGLFRRPEVERLIREHRQGVDHATRLWVLLQLELWHRHVVESPVERGELVG